MTQDDMITLQIDDREVSVPKGTNIIEAAKMLGIEIPFYCYHPHLSVPGNCRMCQVEVEGAPKLMIGCHTQVAEGMVVRTHQTSEQVENAQASTMEMLLINHPLDCTVCDQAGHCKLQDYHYEYNAKPSRFLEYKQNKPKAVPLGPTVMLDAERCIACTRCVRFCDEVTETGEIGLLNRGDRYTIAVDDDRPLNNPASGTVVDLCPVGALTHRNWRFNTRIWYATPKDSIDPHCSKGCNVKVFERDGQIVQVKARLNPHVNKEWLSDESRYGFHDFLPEERVTKPLLKGEEKSSEEISKEFEPLKSGKTLVLLSPDLVLEEFAIVDGFCRKALNDYDAVVSVRTRVLTPLELKFMNPDKAPNFRGAVFSQALTQASDGSREELEKIYLQTIEKIKSGTYDSIVFVGDRSLPSPDSEDLELLKAIEKTPYTLGILTDKESALCMNCSVVLPGRSILERSGLFMNADDRLQYCDQVVQFPAGTESSWRWLGKIADALGHSVVDARSDRDLTISYLGAEQRLASLTIRKIKGLGVDLNTFTPRAPSGESGSEQSVGV